MQDVKLKLAAEKWGGKNHAHADRVTKFTQKAISELNFKQLSVEKLLAPPPAHRTNSQEEDAAMQS